jgi:cytoskeletal protein CcmA (bactofilin family)
MGKTSQRYRARDRARRRGVALLLVLIILAVGSLVTVRFLQAASDRSVLTQTLVESKKAQYIAESGLSEACYWLRHPELTGGTAWTGVTGRGTSQDFYNVTVAPKAGKPTWYVATSQGHHVDGAGNDTVRTVSADFRMYYGFAEAVITPNDLLVPAGTRITGNVYAYNKLDNRGTIDGSVWVNNTYLNTGTITGMKNLYCAWRNIGSYPIDTIVFYWYKGNSCIVDTILTSSATDQTWKSSSGNPAGVWYRNGNLTLNGTTTVEGTLYVLGNLTLAAGSTTVITPKENWPALLVKGNLVLGGNATTATINGTVILHGEAQAAGSMPATKLTINGSLVFPVSGGRFDWAFSSDAKVKINHDPARADVSGFYGSQPRTLAGARMMSYRADGT